MREEFPLLFEAICTEIYEDSNIKNISIPTWNNEYIYIYYFKWKDSWTTKGDLDGWIFNNGIRLNIEDLNETEYKFKQLKTKQNEYN